MSRYKFLPYKNETFLFFRGVAINGNRLILRKSFNPHIVHYHYHKKGVIKLKPDISKHFSIITPCNHNHNSDNGNDNGNDNDNIMAIECKGLGGG